MKISRSFLVWSSACVIFLAGCSSGGNANPSGTTGSASQQTSGQTYTLADVAKHNTPDDCWMAIHGKVYDVSGFGSSGHPGGQAIYQGCGIDATTLFETRPMGSGTPHSELARALMDHFYIGDLKT